jgi:coproporphyrinogen III oxidase-like Fe-S oxidoreductase
MNGRAMNIKPVAAGTTLLPGPHPGQAYMLYAHIPFCERLCPYCSFNRFPFEEGKAHRYYANLRAEMRMLAGEGYDFESLYIGGGTPTILIDELCETIDLARELFHINEVSSETNPNHLTPEYVGKLQGRVQRLSVGVQSFDDGLLQQMQRYDKYGSGMEILERLQACAGAFTSLNVDMIFNFPSQTEATLIHDLACILESGVSQTTFYPLMASPAVEASLAATVGRVDYAREARYYTIISEALCGGANPAYTFSSAWTFNRRAAATGLPGDKTAAPTAAATPAAAASAGAGPSVPQTVIPGVGALRSQQGGQGDGARDGAGNQMIDEYIVDYEEYPAIGSGGFSFLDGSLYVNTFSIREYNESIEQGRMSLMGTAHFSTYNRMRYRFMMQLFGLRLDKRQWRRDFGRPIELSLPAEYAFYKSIGAFDVDDAEQLTLSAKGRYMLVALMRQFFIGVNGLRDQARAALPPDERELLFG